MRTIIILINLIFALVLPLKADKLILLSNHGNAGDHNQVLGIEKAIIAKDPKRFTTQDIDTSKVASQDIQQIIEKSKGNENIVVLGAGEGGVQGIKDINPQERLLIVLTSHMFLNDYKKESLINKVNFFVLPSYISKDEKTLLKGKLIETTGVCHNKSPDVVVKAYENYKQEIPKAESYLVVMLGGDAPNKDNKINHFSLKDAEDLAEFVIARATKDKATIVVLNGPRTGKYDAKDQEIKQAHRDGKLDFITTHFMEKLLSKVNPNQIKIFDFQFDNKSPYNSFDLALGALLKNNGILLIPGDSISMASEAIDILPEGKVILYENGAMSEVHSAYVTSLREKGMTILKNYKNLMAPVKNVPSCRFSASHMVADQILKELQ